MKPHPRIRKTIKWGGAVVTVLLVVVWLGSGWWRVIWGDGHGGTVSLEAGGFCVAYVDIDGVPWDGWHMISDHPVPAWKPRLRWTFEIGSRRNRVLFIPLWAPALLTFIPTTAAWHFDTRARRRARIGLCPKCNYNRTGISKDAKCPECGSEGVSA